VLALSLIELKKKILRLLREDEEFKLAVAGLLGLDTILSELRKLREDFLVFMKEQEKRWEENSKRWEENNKRWEENWRRWEENAKWWERNWKLWEENTKKWEENWKRWEENNKRWEEAYKRFEAIEKILLEHSIRLRNLEKRVSRVELEIGALSEITLTRYVWEDLREEAKFVGEEVVSKARNIKIDKFDVDLIVETNMRVYVVEVKVKPTRKHVNRLLLKAKAVEAKYGKPVVAVLAGTMIGDDVETYAKNKNIRVYNY
jgi:hypothetical protein